MESVKYAAEEKSKIRKDVKTMDGILFHSDFNSTAKYGALLSWNSLADFTHDSMDYFRSTISSVLATMWGLEQCSSAPEKVLLFFL